MQLCWGSYKLPANAFSITRTVETRKNAKGTPYEETHTVQAVGTLTCNLTNYLDRQRYFVALEQQIRIQTAISGGQDLVFKDSGGLPTDMVLPAANARIRPHRVQFSNPVGGNSEYAGNRTIGLFFQAVYPSIGAFGSLLSFNETWEVVGDGSPYSTLRELQDGIQEYTTRIQTICQAFHSGSAVGYNGFPILGNQPGGFPNPKFPDGYRGFRKKVGKQTPQEQGNGFDTGYLMTWAYYSESANPYTI